MLKILKGRLSRFVSREDGVTAVEAGIVVAIVFTIIGLSIKGITDDRDSQKPDEMYQANEQLATKIGALVYDDATVAASNLTAAIPTTSIPSRIRMVTGVMQGPNGGSIVPTGTGARGFILTWNAVDQDYCKEFLARYANETGSGRLSGISVNATVQTLPVGLTARSTACDEAGEANIIAYIYDLDKF